MKNYIVHSFTLGDVDDPDLYAAEPLYNWEQSDAGQFIMKNALETPMWVREVNHAQYGYNYAIKAKLKPEHYTFYKLKFL